MGRSFCADIAIKSGLTLGWLIIEIAMTVPCYFGLLCSIWVLCGCNKKFYSDHVGGLIGMYSVIACYMALMYADEKYR